MGMPGSQATSPYINENDIEKGQHTFGDLPVDGHHHHLGELTNQNTTEDEGEDAFSSEEGSFSPRTQDRSGSAKARHRIESELRTGDVAVALNTSPDVH